VHTFSTIHVSVRVCVPKKNIPNIIDCHLKKGYPILIIFGTDISGTSGHQISASALLRENRTNEIWVEM